jgi:small-conductance mechanosensitive channel
VNRLLRKKLLIIATIQISILVLSLITYGKISLFSYINISFCITSALLFTSLLVYTIHSGFFDVMSRSFSLAFSRGANKRKFEEIPPLSEIVTINQKPMIFYGLINGTFMLIALVVYYI